mgnify:CR=1 FL=1
MKYKIIPVKADFLDKVRISGVDDQNQQVEISHAVGGEPCRDVLRGAMPGEKMILRIKRGRFPLIEALRKKNHKPIISTTLKAQHTEKDFGFADVASFSNQFRFSLTARFCTWLRGFIFTVCGPFWQTQQCAP